MNDPHPHATDDKWWDKPSCLSQLWEYLEDIGETPASPAYFMEKPWKWEAEWQAYLVAYQNGEQ